MVRVLREWWWTRTLRLRVGFWSTIRRGRLWYWRITGKECLTCGFSHPHPDQWHTFPYWRDRFGWRY